MSNELAKIDDSSQQIQRADAIMTFHNEWNKWLDVATTVHKAGMLNISVWKSPSAIMLGFMKCYELGIPPMTGIMGMFLINGKIGMEVTLQNAVIQKSGERTKMIIEDGEGFCRIKMERKDGAEYTALFTRQDAQKAGLMNKDNWKNWEKDMLRSRAFAIGNRVLFSHVLLGMHYTPEELGFHSTYVNGEEVPSDKALQFDEEMEFERMNREIVQMAKTKPTLEMLQTFYDINKEDIAKLGDAKLSLIMTMYNREIKKYGDEYVISRRSIEKQDDATEAAIVNESIVTDTVK